MELRGTRGAGVEVLWEPEVAPDDATGEQMSGVGASLSGTAEERWWDAEEEVEAAGRVWWCCGRTARMCGDALERAAE